MPQREQGPMAKKTKHTCTTHDGWRLRLVRTQRPDLPSTRHHPLLLLPGLGSSGVHSFDLSPAISVADYLAAQGWDVWIAELRGNGESDKPSLWNGRSRWWTIDDYVDVDVPAILEFICDATGCRQLQIMAHSMGGMIVSRLLALNGAPAARLRSVILIGSSPFLEGSWWQAFETAMQGARFVWMLPAGTALNVYSWIALTRLGIPLIDNLYFYPGNARPSLGRALLSRNFSSISPGVVLQFKSAFRPAGLMTADASEPFAETSRLAKVSHPVYVIVGDRDRMCPPWGCRKLYDRLGSPDKVFECVGPKNGQRTHYGHFDILMGKVAETEVFHKLHGWFEAHDSPAPAAAAAAGGTHEQPRWDSKHTSHKAAGPQQQQHKAASRVISKL